MQNDLINLLCYGGLTVNINQLCTFLMAATGDRSKPLLVAICLIVSIILMVVLIITGKNNGKEGVDEDKTEDTEE